MNQMTQVAQKCAKISGTNDIMEVVASQQMTLAKEMEKYGAEIRQETVTA